MEYKTQTRQQILDCMIENPDRIFKASDLAQSLPAVSLSTIYRNLSRLEKAGMVQIVGAEENKELQYRYTGPGRCEAKMHLMCKDCGKFFHLDGPALKMLQVSIQRVSGFELDQQQSVLLGRCSGCSGSKRRPKPAGRKRKPLADCQEPGHTGIERMSRTGHKAPPPAMNLKRPGAECPQARQRTPHGRKTAGHQHRGHHG